MIRCHVCGRLLSGLRADHTFHCQIAEALRVGSVPEIPRSAEIRRSAAIPERKKIEEGSGSDPFTLNPGDFARVA